MRTGEPALYDDDEFVFERRCRGLKFGTPLWRILATSRRKDLRPHPDRKICKRDDLVLLTSLKGINPHPFTAILLILSRLDFILVV